MRVITLLTDYGVVDTYVGQMKGAILAISPQARLVDLTHGVPAQDVRTGAFLLWSAVEAFAPGTLHVAVVDPGVGSKRRAIAVKSARGDVLVGPDNGLLGPAIDRLGGMKKALELDEPKFWRRPTSSTFHGRDIFGPVAGHLVRGAKWGELGSDLSEIQRPIQFPPVTREGAQLRGEVLHIDTFGNLVTNIPETLLPSRYGVDFDRKPIKAKRHYAEVESGQLLALVGSYGLLEISVRDGDAAAQLGAARGDTVRVTER